MHIINEVLKDARDSIQGALRALEDGVYLGTKGWTKSCVAVVQARKQLSRLSLLDRYYKVGYTNPKTGEVNMYIYQWPMTHTQACTFKGNMRQSQVDDFFLYEVALKV